MKACHDNCGTYTLGSKYTFGFAVENLHRAEKTASEYNLAFKKIIVAY